MIMLNDIEQYREMLGSADDMKHVMQTFTQKTQRQTNERWTGKVVDNEDPDKLGRVRIKVIGFYDDLADDILPWAIPDIAWIGGKNGSQIIPEIGSMVRGYFDCGDIQKPIFDSLAFNAANSESDYTSRQTDGEYPHKMILMETDQGDFLTLNRKNGELCFTHRSGAMTIIDKDGNITVKTGTNTSSWLDLNVNGNYNINVNGNAAIYANKNVTVDAGGFIDLGHSPSRMPVNNLPNCPICGVALSTQQKVRV